MTEYQELQKALGLAEQEKNAVVDKAENELDAFIRSQTFTGEELFEMRNEITKGNHESSSLGEPRLNYIIDRILQYRGEQL